MGHVRVPAEVGTHVLQTAGRPDCHHRHVDARADAPPAPSRWAWPLLALCIALTAVTVGLDARAGGRTLPGVVGQSWPTALAGLALAVPGVLLLRRMPRHRIAWVMALGGLLWCLDAAAGAYVLHAVLSASDAPAASLAFFGYQRLGAVLLLPLPLVLLLFPDGRLPTPRLLRVPALATLGVMAAYPLVLAVVPSAAAERFHGQPLPDAVRGFELDPVSVALPYGVWEVLLGLTTVASLVSLVVPLLVVALRFRRADGERRAQLRWLLAAGAVAALAMLSGRLLPAAVVEATLPVAVALVAAAVAVAVLRYRLYDLDLLLGWTLLYALLAGLVVVVDIAVFSLAGAVVTGRESALLATFAVALVYGPLRARLHHVVQRLVRGRRDDPYAVVSALAARLEDSSDPDEQLAAVARSVAAAFCSRYVRVELRRSSGDQVVVEHGTPVERTISLPVAYRGEPIGRLVLAPAAGQRLSDDDQRLLGDVVRQAAAAHRSAQLAQDLQASRAALVTAREEERRRLRRDLHDGLGPALGAVSLRVETARLVSDPARADALLAEAVGDVRGVLDDVRRLVHDLRPPALDEVGLVGALEQQAERLARGGPGGLDVAVVAEGDLSGLPAAVEVAAYRIVSEALANVVRHAAARRATVRLVAGEALEVEVADDGTGIDAAAPSGVGLVSLRERTAELGGAVSITCPPDGGTVVRARLPLVRVPAQARPVQDVPV